MSYIVKYWVERVTSLEKTINDIPSLVKNDVIKELNAIGFVTNDDLEDVIDAKVAQMSTACNKAIVSGFDITMSDGESHHFDFTLEEQENLMYLKSQIDAGATAVPYHASNEACRFFSAEEVNAIIEQGIALKTYHTTYFNALKLYIKDLDNVEAVLNVSYGMDIPEDYQTEVLQAIVSES